MGCVAIILKEVAEDNFEKSLISLLSAVMR